MKNIKKNLISGTIIAFLGLVSYAVIAQPKEDLILLDNHSIQTYKNRAGIWIILEDSKKNLEDLYEETGTHPQEFFETNELVESRKIPKSKPLFFPYSEEKLAEIENQGQSRESISSPTDKLVWPVILDKHSRITSRIGRRWHKFHTGMDIACVRGSVIVAAADGEVEEAGWMGHYGKVVRISHPQVSHIETLYAHNTHVLVKKGDLVKKGQIIAYSGSTGKSTGPHLHFEVRYQNIFLNPEHFLPEFPDFQETIAQLD